MEQQSSVQEPPTPGSLVREKEDRERRSHLCAVLALALGVMLAIWVVLPFLIGFLNPKLADDFIILLLWGFPIYLLLLFLLFLLGFRGQDSSWRLMARIGTILGIGTFIGTTAYMLYIALTG